MRTKRGLSRLAWGFAALSLGGAGAGCDFDWNKYDPRLTSSGTGDPTGTGAGGIGGSGAGGAGG
ncbi:MAG: hypothetical protein R3B70_45630, partial [Polyangiaceae bacterium]